jgi:hypothetical protein
MLPGGLNRGTQPERHVQSTTVYKPVNEVDSFYDINTSTWNYVQDAFHTYYQSNCLDSVIVYTVNGNNSSHVSFQYDQWNFVTYQLTETWNGSNWVNSSLNLSQGLPDGCFFQFNYYLNWNGLSWDTLNGSQKTISTTYDSLNNRTQIVRQHYINNAWVNYYTYNFSYNVSQEVNSWSRFRWDTTLNQYTPDWRDTNFTYYSYSNFCIQQPQTHEHQTWNGSSWQNNFKAFNMPQSGNIDTAYLLSWNGSSYADSLEINITKNDSLNTYFGEIAYTYDTAFHSWSIGYYDWFFLTYGINNEIIRKEEISDNYTPTPDSIAPQNVYLYSNFISCNPLGIESVSFLNNDISVYPNPASRQLFIEAKETSINDVKIYDMPGQKLFSTHVDGSMQKKIAIDLSKWDNGIYILQISSAKETITRKFLLSK